MFCSPCNDELLLAQANDSTIVLDPVKYGTTGKWAINIWMKPGSLYGNNFQYMFSHAQNKFYQTGWESNQVRKVVCYERQAQMLELYLATTMCLIT